MHALSISKDEATFASPLLLAIREAAEHGLAPAPAPNVLTGFAADKLTSLLQRLPAVVGGDYIEVGVFQGGTLLSVAHANPSITCFGIDNYSAHNPAGRNKALVGSRAEQLAVSNYRLIDQDFEDGLLGFPEEAGTYFVDGPHDYRSQLICLGYAPRFLKRGGVIVVDDANYPHVRQATADFLVMFPEFKLVFEAYTERHPANMTASEADEARKGWGNGVHVIAHDPDDRLEGLTPPVPTNARFIRDHDLHIARHAPLAYEAADLVQAVLRPWQLPKAIARLARAAWTRRHELAGRYRSTNTESDGLPTRIAEMR